MPTMPNGRRSRSRAGWGHPGSLAYVKAGGSLVLTADADAAARQAVADARASLGAQPPSFAVLFASADFASSAPALVAAVAEETGGVPLIGCVAQAVAGGAREVESGPAVSLWLASDLGPVETFAHGVRPDRERRRLRRLPVHARGFT